MSIRWAPEQNEMIMLNSHLSLGDALGRFPPLNHHTPEKNAAGLRQTFS